MTTPDTTISRGPIPSYFEISTGARTKTRYKVFQPYHLTVFRDLMSETWHDIPELRLLEPEQNMGEIKPPKRPKKRKPTLTEINKE